MSEDSASPSSPITELREESLIEKIINSVEKRPVLYNKHLKEYSNRLIKTKLWAEVCVEVFPEWNMMSENEKGIKGKEVQNKWKNVKDRFAKELSALKNVKSGQAARKKRKYVYFDNLLFLLPLTQTETATTTNISNQTFQSSNPSTSSADIYPPIGRVQSNLRKKQQPQRDTNNNEYNEQILDILRKKANEDLDEEKYFALSLVPILKKLDDYQKHYAKTEILRVIMDAKHIQQQYLPTVRSVSSLPPTTPTPPSQTSPPQQQYFSGQQYVTLTPTPPPQTPTPPQECLQGQQYVALTPTPPPQTPTPPQQCLPGQQFVTLTPTPPLPTPIPPEHIIIRRPNTQQTKLKIQSSRILKPPSNEVTNFYNQFAHFVDDSLQSQEYDVSKY